MNVIKFVNFLNKFLFIYLLSIELNFEKKNSCVEKKEKKLQVYYLSFVFFFCSLLFIYLHLKEHRFKHHLHY